MTKYSYPHFVLSQHAEKEDKEFIELSLCGHPPLSLRVVGDGDSGKALTVVMDLLRIHYKARGAHLAQNGTQRFRMCALHSVFYNCHSYNIQEFPGSSSPQTQLCQRCRVATLY